AKILSYNAKGRTAQVHIHGLTDGASEGITATFAYPVGDSDLDTSVHDKFHRTLILSGFCLLKIAKISLNSSFFPK
ncbi:hypothetical protein NYZ11_19905, partial [Acinetobacter baumannii]|nr:hypothetical protein [Acinetobacter baumannii]MCZ3122571.1 hypothetical protein [Acinetobacter baumannii]